ncbi:unnamed protein product [Prorocentrum cordatum]|uniref:RNA helicase n=1 Tax=Prorocentrum cordatum TaxID=2364126 RepID=A0ABN9QTG1_9DINO|nr:unnamed protein product [Polarella glacialis]
MARRLAARGPAPAGVGPGGALAALEACREGALWERALALVGRVHLPGLAARDVAACYNAALAACAGAAAWRPALALLQRLLCRPGGAEARSSEYTSAVGACARRAAWAHALALLELARRRRAALEAAAYNAAVTACVRVALWPGALALLREGAGVAGHNAAVSACREASQWERAVQIVCEMQAGGLGADVVSHSAVIAALHRGAHWERALLQLAAMDLGQSGLAPNAVSLCSALSACRRGARWAVALQVLRALWRGGAAELNAVACTQAFLLYEELGLRSRAAALVRRIAAVAGSPDVVSHTAAIRACGGRTDPAADRAFRAGAYAPAVARLRSLRRLGPAARGPCRPVGALAGRAAAREAAPDLGAFSRDASDALRLRAGRRCARLGRRGAAARRGSLWIVATTPDRDIDIEDLEVVFVAQAKPPPEAIVAGGWLHASVAEASAPLGEGDQFFLEARLETRDDACSAGRHRSNDAVASGAFASIFIDWPVSAPRAAEWTAEENSRRGLIPLRRELWRQLSRLASRLFRRARVERAMLHSLLAGMSPAARAAGKSLPGANWPMLAAGPILARSPCKFVVFLIGACDAGVVEPATKVPPRLSFGHQGRSLPGAGGSDELDLGRGDGLNFLRQAVAVRSLRRAPLELDRALSPANTSRRRATQSRRVAAVGALRKSGVAEKTARVDEVGAVGRRPGGGGVKAAAARAHCLDGGALLRALGSAALRRQNEQQLIFQRPEKGKTKVILGTNIAESSVTIDDVLVVVDSGLMREAAMDVDGEAAAAAVAGAEAGGAAAAPIGRQRPAAGAGRRSHLLGDAASDSSSDDRGDSDLEVDLEDIWAGAVCGIPVPEHLVIAKESASRAGAGGRQAGRRRRRTWAC